MNTDTENRGDVWLVYDGECPICRTYCTYVRLREAVGKLHLVDARQPSALMDEITAAGIDIDQGMVVKIKDTIFYGAEAIRILTLMTTKYGMLNRLNYLFFGSRFSASVAYPFGKTIRTVVLKILGIRYIENLKQTSAELVDRAKVQ